MTTRHLLARGAAVAVATLALGGFALASMDANLTTTVTTDRDAHGDSVSAAATMQGDRISDLARSGVTGTTLSGTASEEASTVGTHADIDNDVDNDDIDNDTDEDTADTDDVTKDVDDTKTRADTDDTNAKRDDDDNDHGAAVSTAAKTQGDRISDLAQSTNGGEEKGDTISAAARTHGMTVRKVAHEDR